MAAFFIPLLIISILSVLSSSANAEIQFHDFIVQETPVKRLCGTKNVITVNGQFPGPTLEVSDGDTLIIKVLNNARYNVTIHWHGILQLGTPWADGPDRITQCPIQPGASYTYRFTILNQEGTLWWHAHSRWLRATVYGALIIHPKLGSSYPFPLPKLEIPILLGQWWNGDIISILNQAMFSGGAPNVSDAYTINGQPGDLYRCSSKDTMRFYVESDDRILLRVINSALNQQLFFTIANHKLTVVGVDALYIKPFTTTTLMLGPGQTTDVILVADQAPGYYYMAARAYESSQNAPFDTTTTTAILAYKFAPCINSQIGTPVKPVLPRLPNYNDSVTVTAFTSQLKSPSKVEVPTDITEDLFFAIGIGLVNCSPGPTCQGPNNTRFAASMNNVSFVLPQTTSLLQAHYQNIPNVFTMDFPPVPPLVFDYTGNVPRALWQPVSGTKLYKLKFGSQVQIVLQDTAIVSTEDHPVHLHGHHFYIVGQGFGNFNPGDTVNFNLEDPPRRNTVNVPVGGWSAIRFVANNPGVWLMHCHIDSHLTWGFAMSFLVENGPGKLESIEAPPLDLPPC